MIVYFPPEQQHLVAAGDRVSGAHISHLLLPVGTESSHIPRLVYCLSLLRILTALFRDEEISPAIM